MDFEWQSRAPGDTSSPFYQLSSMHQKKRTHSVFDSPTKKPTPSLREPNSQPFLFSLPPSQPPKSIFGQPAFTTPRKIDLDFSSGAENMSSPEADDDTPEQPSKTERQNSLFNFSARFPPSPGRGEIPRINNYSNAVARRIQKRRQRDRELDRRLRRGSETGSDRPGSSEGRSTAGSLPRGEGKSTSRLSSFGDFFALLEAHPNIPNILSWWAQLIVNLTLFSLAVYVVLTFVSAIRTEFDHAAEERSDLIVAEMAVCAKNYVDNRCAGGDRLPALETVCENWERCMNRDPAKVGRAKLSARTMAEIINNFIDPISWKAILFFIATLATVTAVSNWSFCSFRQRLNQRDYAHHATSFPNHPSGQHHPPMYSQQIPYQSMPGFGYFGRQEQDQELPQPNPTRAPSLQKDTQEEPLMIESSRQLEFVTDRSRERKSRLRTPSPSKRERKFL